MQPYKHTNRFNSLTMSYSKEQQQALSSMNNEEEYIPMHGFRVGPVVGWVGSTHARILLEVNSYVPVDVHSKWYQLVYEDNVKNRKSQQPQQPREKLVIHMTESNRVRNEPFVFICNQLEPSTEYKVECWIELKTQQQQQQQKQSKNQSQESKHCFARFKTPDWNPELKCEKTPEKIVVLSCNLNDRPVPWNALYRNLPDLLLHIGDQVYLDECFLRGMIRPQWTVEQMEQDIRDTYAEYWSRPSVAQVLSSCPNIMIGDDHEECDDKAVRIQQKTSLFNATRYRQYRHLAQKIAWEYQELLCPDVFRQWSYSHAMEQMNMTMRINSSNAVLELPNRNKCFEYDDLTILLIDTRTNRDNSDSSGFLTMLQKQWIRDQLTRSNQIRNLLFITPTSPVSYRQHWLYNWITFAVFQDSDMVQMRQAWIRDTEWMMQQLAQWKYYKNSHLLLPDQRQIVWVGGDLHYYQQARLFVTLDKPVCIDSSCILSLQNGSSVRNDSMCTNSEKNRRLFLARYYTSSSITSSLVAPWQRYAACWFLECMGITAYQGFEFEVDRQRFENHFLMLDYTATRNKNNQQQKQQEKATKTFIKRTPIYKSMFDTSSPSTTLCKVAVFFFPDVPEDNKKSPSMFQSGLQIIMNAFKS